MPHLPQICPVCKNKDNLYFIKAFTGVSNLIAKLTFAQCSKSDQNSFFNSFAQDSKSEQKFTLFVFRSV